MSKKPTKEHYREIMDRTNMVVGHMQAAFEGHPAMSNRLCYSRYVKIEDELGELFDEAERQVDKFEALEE